MSRNNVKDSLLSYFTHAMLLKFTLVDEPEKTTVTSLRIEITLDAADAANGKRITSDFEFPSSNI